METQQTNAPITALPLKESELAVKVKFFKDKLDGIYARMLNYQPLTSEQEVDLLWLFRAEKLWDDGRFDEEIENFRFVPAPKKTYNSKKKREAAAGVKANGMSKRRTVVSRFKKAVK